MENVSKPNNPVRTGRKDKGQRKLARLIRDRIVRPGRRALPLSFFGQELPRLKDAGSVVAALLEERRTGR